MTSAAKKAAKTLKGSRRNRPSLSMSQGTAASSVGESSGENLGNSFTARDAGGGGGGSGGPLFMDELQSQYESLSEKLNRENKNNTSSTQYSDTKSGGSSAGSKSSRKVRWAETAAVASTMDAENAAAAVNDDDPDRYERSPMEILSDLFQKSYTLPIFLIATLAIFLMVHLAGGGDEKYKRYDAASNKASGSLGKRFNRYKNLEGGTGFGETTFSLSPTSADMASIGPTSEAIGRSTPKIPGSSPTGATANDGNAADWIIVPTQSGVFGGSPGGVEGSDGSPTTLKWGFPEG